jgi:hypothetical protein
MQRNLDGFAHSSIADADSQKKTSCPRKKEQRFFNFLGFSWQKHPFALRTRGKTAVFYTRKKPVKKSSSSFYQTNSYC